MEALQSLNGGLPTPIYPSLEMAHRKPKIWANGPPNDDGAKVEHPRQLSATISITSSPNRPPTKHQPPTINKKGTSQVPHTARPEPGPRPPGCASLPCCAAREPSALRCTPHLPHLQEHPCPPDDGRPGLASRSSDSHTLTLK